MFVMTGMERNRVLSAGLLVRCFLLASCKAMSSRGGAIQPLQPWLLLPRVRCRSVACVDAKTFAMASVKFTARLLAPFAAAMFSGLTVELRTQEPAS